MNRTVLPTIASAIGMQNFRHWCRNLRESHKESQEELGRVLGLDRKTIMAFEIGTRVPKLDIVMQIAEHYGLKEVSFRITDAAPEPQNRIAYLCDGQSKCKKTGCGLSQSGEFYDCYRTFDIDHAKNFRKVAAHWYEEVSESSDRLSVNDRKSEEMKLNNTKQ